MTTHIILAVISTGFIFVPFFIAHKLPDIKWYWIPSVILAWFISVIIIFISFVSLANNLLK